MANGSARLVAIDAKGWVGTAVLLEGSVELPIEVQERNARRDGLPVEAGDRPRELFELLELGAD